MNEFYTRISNIVKIKKKKHTTYTISWFFLLVIQMYEYFAVCKIK